MQASRVCIATYYSLDVLVHIAGQDVVGRWIKLIQRAGRDLQHSGQADARPVVLVGTEALWAYILISLDLCCVHFI